MKKKKNSKVYEYLKAFSGITLSGTAGDVQSDETKKGFFRSLFDKKEDEDNKFNVGHATLMGLNIFNHLLPQQNLYNNNPIILESYNPNMYGTGSQAIMQNGGTVNGGGGGKERLVGDDFYAANATLSYYKNILNEKLKEKNPEAFSNYFKKLVEFRRNNDVEGEKKYIQES